MSKLSPLMGLILPPPLIAYAVNYMPLPGVIA